MNPQGTRDENNILEKLAVNTTYIRRILAAIENARSLPFFPFFFLFLFFFFVIPFIQIHSSFPRTKRKERKKKKKLLLRSTFFAFHASPPSICTALSAFHCAKMKQKGEIYSRPEQEDDASFSFFVRAGCIGSAPELAAITPTRLWPKVIFLLYRSGQDLSIRLSTELFTINSI